MKPTIQERMERQINSATKYNQLFDLMVETTETSFSTTSTMQGDNRYDVTTSSIVIQVICNDNDWNTVTIYILDPAHPEEGNQVGVVTINVNGGVDETFHNIPRALRRIINDYVDDIYDAIDGWIDELENGNGND